MYNKISLNNGLHDVAITLEILLVFRYVKKNDFLYALVTGT